jgi:Na+-transporting NADH:ubiquinone oxidoreductase subunit B
MKFRRPDKLFLKQKVMLRVCYALTPLVFAAVYLFGWRSLVLVLIVTLIGIATEALFTWNQGKPVTSAVFVTSLIFALSLPPSTPFWMAVTGIVAGVALGKMVFGGFGQNVFNPAMLGRCFIYVTFPMELTNQWVEPILGGAAGFGRWSTLPDAATMATPMAALRQGADVPLESMFFGFTSGSLGETSAFLILLGGIYLIYTKAASYRLALSCLIGGAALSGLLHALGVPAVPSPHISMVSGSFFFGAVFVVTEPISGAKTQAGQWIYGFLIGALTIVLRGYSNFSEGIMFSVLIMNAFVPILDRTVQQIKASRKAIPA